METMMSMLDPELSESTQVMETARPTELAQRITVWFRSLVQEFDDADMVFDPLIDFPRDF